MALGGNTEQHLPYVAHSIVFAGARTDMLTIEHTEGPGGEHARADAHDDRDHEGHDGRREPQEMEQAADHTEGQRTEDPEPQREKDREKTGVCLRVRITLVGVEVMLDVRRGIAGIAVSLSSHQKLHHDGAETED